ncbi:hypothetical protein CTI12_AA528560 [Artemisia annua]|uniref:Uncharacterized protein n=1 Tax=Artemisia annua TaxID=35608 RepID=A0A2U1L5M0_ARTAN|nr:hypothetical protein CTI12_AA528560 [Artemisia annua]
MPKAETLELLDIGTLTGKPSPIHLVGGSNMKWRSIYRTLLSDVRESACLSSTREVSEKSSVDACPTGRRRAPMHDQADKVERVLPTSCATL